MSFKIADFNVRLVLLQGIFDHFQQITQWCDYDDGRRTEYSNKAEALIEILEVADCGSIGGFDKKNPMIRTTGHQLFDRYLTLLRKNDDAANIKPVCNANVETLTQYFIALRNLRTTIYQQYPA